MKPSKYEVIVGNVGTVYAGNSKHFAAKTYADYVRQSVRGIGRAGDEEVTLFCDGDIIGEHQGTKGLLDEKERKM